MKIPINSEPCPKCRRIMGKHCEQSCGWLFCGICDLILDRKSKRTLGLFKGNGWKPE